MNLIILISIIQVVWADRTAFYHGKSIEFVPPHPLRDNSYFGFSTTYDRYNRKMIISAPTEDKNGKVYECNITDQNCLEIGNNIKRETPKEYDHDYWFGATVKAGSNFVLACTPRLTKMYSKLQEDIMMHMAATYGQCYKRIQNQKKFDIEVKTRANTESSIPVEQIMEPLGWSLDIADDSIIVGGPGMYQRKGLAAVMPLPNKYASLDYIVQYKDPKASFNFGYSVAIGYYLDKKNKWFAVSSTYGVNGEGGVYFYRYSGDNRWSIAQKKGIDDELVGSMFGAVLCSANLYLSNGNKPSDLLVGAPTYASHLTYDAGAVYVYISKSNGIIPSYHKKITFQKSGSFFGSAIVSVGDLNGDGQDEIAIAAPYEGGVGAVYLYSGAELASDKSKSLAYLQRISPSGYHSFGLGLSVLQDHDNNGCNELAISSPYDNRVNVYSCLASVTITKITVEFPKLQNRDHKQESFKFTVCIHGKYPDKPRQIIGDIAIDVTINHIHAKLIYPNNDNMFTFTKSLDKRETQLCEEIDIYLPLDGNYGILIGYEVSIRLLNNPMERSFDSARVVLSDNSVLFNKDAIWAADCTGDKECNPILNMTISSNISKPFIIGSKEMETFKIDVLNTGEIAYNPCIHIKVNSAVLYRPPTDCSKLIELDNVYECTYRKPLRNSKIWTIDDITLNLKALTSRHSNLTIDAVLFNQCKGKKTQVLNYDITLESDYKGIGIKGTTNIGDIINVNKDSLRDGKQFEHIYTITNNGMTNFENLKTEVKVIKETFMNYPENFVSTLRESKYKTNERVYCPIKFDGFTEIIAECAIDNLPKTHFFKVRISMGILPGSLEYDELLHENATQLSDITLQINSYNTKESIITQIQIKETAVALWIIILAVLVGILLIIILIIALSMCGCLTRQKKEELKELKEKVRRESVRRSMRVPAQREVGRQTIVEECEEMGQEVQELDKEKIVKSRN